MKRLFSFAISLLLLFSLTSCAADKPLSRTVTALDTVCTISLYDGKDEIALDGAIHELRWYEEQWSRTKGVEVIKLNAANGEETTVSSATYQLLLAAQHYSRATDGAFDITTAPLTDLWQAAQDNNVLPTKDELTQACATVGADKMQFGEYTVTLAKGTKIDLGGIAKGAIADEVAGILREGGCSSALIDLGGNIVALGAKPNGEPFHIGIADPRNEEALIATVAVRDCAVVTSGSYQRGYEIAGKRYSHILDPKTGYPVDNDLASVTIIAPLALDADVLSTACFVMGYEKARAFLDTYEDVEAVFVKTDGSVIATDGVDLV